MAAKSRSNHIDGYEWRYVILSIEGKNLNPDKVTEWLNIPPDGCGRRGEPFGKNKKSKQGYWVIEGRPSRSRLETQMKSILKRISPVKHRLRTLIKENKDVRRVYLTIAVQPPDWAAMPGYCFSADLINEFTSLGIDLAISIHMPAFFRIKK